MPFEMKFTSDFYQIEVDRKSGLLSSQWLRPANVEEIKAGGEKLYEVLNETKIEKAVANAQALGTLSPEAKEWMATAFYELLSKTKLKKLARVLPSNLFHQIALESVAARAEALGVTKFQVKNFSNQEEALKWLAA